MNTVTFKIVEGREVPCHPWPQVFYVSREFLEINGVELRPLTITGLVKGVGKNFISMNYWRFMRLLNKIGFLDAPEAHPLSWKHWRWRFWRPRRPAETRLREDGWRSIPIDRGSYLVAVEVERLWRHRLIGWPARRIHIGLDPAEPGADRTVVHDPPPTEERIKELDEVSLGPEEKAFDDQVDEVCDWWYQEYKKSKRRNKPGRS